MCLQAGGLGSWNVEPLHALCLAKSVWTVDLAHLLARCGVRSCVYTTTCLGANPAYAAHQLEFYMDHLSEDADRVNKLFKVRTTGYTSQCIQLGQFTGLTVQSPSPSCRRRRQRESTP